MRLLVTAFLIISLHVGCFRQVSRDATNADFPELTTLAAVEVAEIAKSVDQPLMVEFSVLHGCDRCARMRPEVRQLAADQANPISIKRADFITNQPLLQSLGATLCPTYVLFAPNSPPQIHTSPEVLISMADPHP